MLEEAISGLTYLLLIAVSPPSPGSSLSPTPTLIPALLAPEGALSSSFFFSLTRSEQWSLFPFPSLLTYPPSQFSHLPHLPRIGTASYEM